MQVTSKNVWQIPQKPHKIGFKMLMLIDSTMTINRWFCMMITCIARNGTCLNGLAKVVEDAIYLRFKKIK